MRMNNLTYKDLDEAIDLIRRSNRIYIASHINPDGDNLGSSLALALALRKLVRRSSIKSRKHSFRLCILPA